MVDNFYNGVIEQVYNQIGKTEKNIVMACYNNDFSISNLENIYRYSSGADEVFFAWHEFEYHKLAPAFAPFLNIISGMYRQYIDGDFDSFLVECGVYQLQRKIFSTYYYTGKCERNEDILLDELEYEQQRMVEGVAGMLKKLSEIKPVMIVINRFQMSGRSTMELVKYLLKNPTNRIGMVLGANESQREKNYVIKVWDEINDMLKRCNLIYHIGTTGIFLSDSTEVEDIGTVDLQGLFCKASNNIELLDYEQLFDFLQHQYTKYPQELFDDNKKIPVQFMILFVRASILNGNLFKALEMLAKARVVGKALPDIRYQCAYYESVCYMYQGKLKESAKKAGEARKLAEALGNEYLVFKADLLETMAQMSGWNNIFFMVNDVAIEESLIEQMIRYGYENHLAHVYIYAYDNDPQVVAKSYRSEAVLVHFGKGVEIAKRLDNEQLLHNAYQKNIMIASTYGMNEISIFYAVRMYQALQDKYSIKSVRVFTALGYNLNAMGHSDLAEKYYSRAIELLYDLREESDIAEVYYNLGLNHMMQEAYEEAGQAFDEALKIIERLHLNSLRVCNLSKLYALMALVSVLKGQQFNCERYLKNCSQFLNYLIENQLEMSDDEVLHDYKVFDDDLFLYNFAAGRLGQIRNELNLAFAHYEEAEKSLERAEGNQFYAHKRFRECRMELFTQMNKPECYEKEKRALEQHMEKVRLVKENTPIDIIYEIDSGELDGKCKVSPQNLELLLKQSGLEIDYLINQKRLEYLSEWQNLIDNYVENQDKLVDNAMWSFVNYFGCDDVVYIRYQGKKPQVLFNNTQIEFTETVLTGIRRSIRNYPEGFAVSKVSENFFEHLDMISYFRANEICSFVAVPCFEGKTLEAVFVTYVRMKENWHSVVNRYMLDDSDLKIYRLIFRELNNAVNRLLANNKIKEMNQKLEQNAVTDILTGLYNRAGMYREARRIEKTIKEDENAKGVGLMFMDLDNFKPYNDTFGHDIGDIVLQGMAAIFRDVAGERGVVSRYGGDEFIIIWDTADKEELENYAKAIYQKIDEAKGFLKVIEGRLGKPIEMGAKSYIGCSIGIAVSALEGGQTIDDLIRQADDALYDVKAKSKGTYAFI